MAMIWNDPALEAAYDAAVAARGTAFAEMDSCWSDRVAALQESPANQSVELACRALHLSAASTALEQSIIASNQIQLEGLRSDNRDEFAQELALQERIRSIMGGLRPTGGAGG